MRLLAGYPAPNLPPLDCRRGRPLPGDVAEHQQHPPGSDPRRLRPAVRQQRLWGRYTHDLSETRELGGLFFNTPIPGVAGTETDVPGQVGAIGLRSILGSNKLNELNYHFSSNNIRPQPAEGVRNTRSDYGVTIPRGVSRRTSATSSRSSTSPGLSLLGANQLYPHSVPESLVHRQLLVAARQPRVQVRRPRQLRAEERERREPRARARSRSSPRPAGRRRSRASCAATRRRVHRLQLRRSRARHRPEPALQPLRVLRAGHLAADARG